MKIILYGFITLVAILQIIYIPLILLHVPFKIVLYTSILVFCLFILFAVYVLRKWIKRLKRKKDKLKKIKNSESNKFKNKNVALNVVLVILILSQAIVSCTLFNENADDSFYVSLMEQNKDQDEIYTVDPTTGIENDSTLSKYKVSGYELFVSVLSKITTISAVTLAHSIIPFFTIILSYMAYYELARKFLNRNKSKVFLILLSVLFLFSGFTARFRGMIMLSRMWQGKEIFLNLVLTLILANLMSLNRYNEKKNLILLTILNISAVFFSNTAIFLVPFAYLAYGIIELIKKRWKLLLKLIFTGIPIAVYGIIFIILTRNGTVLPKESVNIIDVFKDYFGQRYWYLILYVISVVIIAIKGSKRAKECFVVVPLIYFVTIYNPLLCNMIAKYFTSSAVFWRLLWLLPVEFSICYACILLLEYKRIEKYQALVFLSEILLLIFAGKFVYTKDNEFTVAKNKYKIPQSVVEHVNYILDNTDEGEIPVLLGPTEPLHLVTVRQLTTKIQLAWSRDSYMQELCTNEEYIEREKLRKISQGEIKPDMLVNDYDILREKYNINWIITSNLNMDTISFLDKTRIVDKKEIAGYVLYKY